MRRSSECGKKEKFLEKERLGREGDKNKAVSIHISAAVKFRRTWGEIFRNKAK